MAPDTGLADRRDRLAADGCARSALLFSLFLRIVLSTRELFGQTIKLSARADGSALLRYAPRSHPRAMHHEPWKGYRAFLRLDFDARPVVHAAGLSRRQAIEHA
jgi:hypothetical protein